MNTFGNKIKITVFGQSHAQAIGVTIEGLPTGLKVDTDRVQTFLDRRAPGKNTYSTQRQEADKVEYLSGLVDGVVCGAPLTAVIFNKDQHSKDYSELRAKMRPSHADYPANVKYGDSYDVRGGGQFSGRMTAPICIAGAILMQYLEEKGIYIGAHISSIGIIKDKMFDNTSFDTDMLLCAGKKDFPVLDDEAGEKMKELILAAKNDLDSVGGIIECMAVGVPAGIGEPMFEGLENVIAQSVFAIPAVKGLEFGLGFESSSLFGSQNNDEYYYDENSNVKTRTNNAGGICGGLATGMPISFKVAMKPTPSIGKAQNTVNLASGKNDVLEIHGRHDPCIVQRAVPCIEAAMALALSQFVL
ncbi:MAG: chorismate synthase [Clostridia bacterium]|nr:chorismate synthase [Clostridia bacterium]